MTLDAGTPIAAVAAAVSLPDGRAVAGVSPMGGGAVGRAGSPRFVVEADALVGINFVMEATTDLWGGLRWHLGDPFGNRGTLSLLAGGGSVWSDGGHPVLGGGVGLDLPAPGPLTVRSGVTWLGSPTGDGQWLVGSVGVAFTRRPPPLPTAAPAPEASAPHLTVADPPPGTRVWLPHPVCDWVPLPEVDTVLATTAPPVPAVVEAEGYLPSRLTVLRGDNAVTLKRAPPQGALFVTTTAGDALSIGAGAVPLGEGGTAQVAVPAGAQDLTVAGGGREVHLALDVPSGFALWVRVPPPQPWTVLFAKGSSEVSEAERQALATHLTQRGGYRLVVQGSASPEGDTEANLVLASARAEATSAALRALGAPADAVEILPPVIGIGGRPAEEERAALVMLRPARGEAP